MFGIYDILTSHAFIADYSPLLEFLAVSFFLLSPARRSQISCVTIGTEISDLIATHPEVLSFKLRSLLLFGVDSKYEYHCYDRDSK